MNSLMNKTYNITITAKFAGWDYHALNRTKSVK